MITEKATITTEAVFSDDRQRRYLLRKEWDDTLPQATLIMLNPSTANISTMDYTTLYTLNNLIKLNFGAVEIVNLTAKPTVKMNVKEDVTENLENENVEQILKSAEKSDTVIIAWGRIGENNKSVRALQEKLLEKLRPFADKLQQIADEAGEVGFHPLAPSIRFVWRLVKFAIPDKQIAQPEAKKKKSAKKEQSENPQ